MFIALVCSLKRFLHEVSMGMQILHGCSVLILISSVVCEISVSYIFMVYICSLPLNLGNLMEMKFVSLLIAEF